jgi:hypothetical protein
MPRSTMSTNLLDLLACIAPEVTRGTYTLRAHMAQPTTVHLVTMPRLASSPRHGLLEQLKSVTCRAT